MNIETLDVHESTGGSSGVSDELSDNGEWLGGVDGLAWTIEVEIAHAVRVDVASVSIALRSISVANTAVEARALVKAVGAVARMRSICVGNGVGLLDIHLVAASAEATSTSVGAVG